MNLLQEIQNYEPFNEQEARDKALMIEYMTRSTDCLNRTDQTAHFTASIWTINKAHTKTLMVYHNIYDSWAWIGGHADGNADLRAVALRELTEETGVKNAVLIHPDIFSLEQLTVNGHIKKGIYVPSHLHMNVTYLAEADEREPLTVNDAENQAVRWWSFEEALNVPNEPWFVEWIYKKLNQKVQSLY
ncbi:MAG: NUDIX hydrolase [Lachnospiraceae bacterium]|nr:NUDIX hydrolase [Lachnospiraceae bacterium]